MTRPRTLLATLLVLAAVLWGAAAAGAQAGPAPSTTITAVTVSPAVPAAPEAELPRTGPGGETTGLGVFGFVLVGVGVVALAGSRKLLTSESVRR